VNIQQLAQKIELQEDECVELLRLFIETSSRDLELLDTAIARGDMKEAWEAAHSLKGSAVSLGLDAFSDSAKNIETEAKHGRISSVSEDIRFLRTQLDEIGASVGS